MFFWYFISAKWLLVCVFILENILVLHYIEQYFEIRFFKHFFWFFTSIWFYASISYKFIFHILKNSRFGKFTTDKKHQIVTNVVQLVLKQLFLFLKCKHCLMSSKIPFKVLLQNIQVDFCFALKL